MMPVFDPNRPNPQRDLITSMFNQFDQAARGNNLEMARIMGISLQYLYMFLTGKKEGDLNSPDGKAEIIGWAQAVATGQAQVIVVSEAHEQPFNVATAEVLGGKRRTGDVN